MSQSVARMNEDESSAWLALVSVAQLLPAALDEELTQDAGLINFEYGVLGVLMVAPDQTLRVGDIVSALAAPYPRVSKTLSRLEGRGLCERVACTGDRRATNVRLTRQGRRTWLRATPPHVAFAREHVLAGLTPGELTTLAGLLGRVLGNLDPEGRFGTLTGPETEPSGQAGRPTPPLPRESPTPQP